MSQRLRRADHGRYLEGSPPRNFQGVGHRGRQYYATSLINTQAPVGLARNHHDFHACTHTNTKKPPAATNSKLHKIVFKVKLRPPVLKKAP